MDFSLYYWTYKKNIGDYFSCWLLDQIISKKDKYHRADENVDVVCTGSILEHKCITPDTYVAGSGWHNYNIGAKFRGSVDNVLGVRGKLTKDFLKLGDNVCLGDPGLLISKYYNPEVEPIYQYGLICHWRDIDFFTEAYKDLNIKLIRTDTYDVEAFVREIKSCKFIFSTSLHGLIFSHAYGIPAVHLEKTKLESRDNFKFKDYFSVLDIDYKKLSYTDSFRFCDAIKALGDFSRYAPSKQCINEVQANLTKMMDTLLVKLNKRYEKQDKLKVALCAIAKCENKYIKEWVKHYKSLGFDKIFLYDNNDLDGEHFEEVINDYIKSGYVEIIDVRGKTNQQIACYDKLYHSSKLDGFDWIAYFDIDEFLNIKADNIKGFLTSPKFANYQAVAINWKYFDDNNISKINGTYGVVARFTHAYDEKDWEFAQHRFSKRIIRTKIPNLVINSSHGPIHRAQMHEYDKTFENKLLVCNSDGNAIYNHLYFTNWTHESAYLAHYRFKTISEYINNKMKRGYPTLYKNSGKDMNLTDFFALNTITEEKLKVAVYLLKLSGEEKEKFMNQFLRQKQEQEKKATLVNKKKDSWPRIM